MKGFARIRSWLAPVLGCGCVLLAPGRVAADPIGMSWPQPGGPGTPVVVTYSFSNLLDGGLGGLSPWQLRAATEEALALWSRYAPLHFKERPDSGPPPSDVPYPANGFPQIRIGYTELVEVARAYFPGSDGLAGDIHFDTTVPWTLGPSRWNFLEAITHELGHGLGLLHEPELLAIMNPSFPEPRFGGLGTAFLFPADIERLQALYGAGNGSVEPIPEPGTLVLVGSGLATLLHASRRRRPAR